MFLAAQDKLRYGQSAAQTAKINADRWSCPECGYKKSTVHDRRKGTVSRAPRLGRPCSHAERIYSGIRIGGVV